eukprot:CAMPEP_0194429668 /NCGR_PEP_ID=MMETSP0176-20130528/48595_1 /TAXON_ID=216777 /ORGANISM="Proboscia alata, Strain PI-D3" /LENGTH=936 /DNA_ID=CAMNT_0039243017 /DNA_START=206 /DNA_END=3016 /DNA_ORIENTATION=+
MPENKRTSRRNLSSLASTRSSAFTTSFLRKKSTAKVSESVTSNKSEKSLAQDVKVSETKGAKSSSANPRPKFTSSVTSTRSSFASKFEEEIRKWKREAKKYETIAKRLRAELRITKEDCKSYRRKLEESLAETGQLKEVLLRAEEADIENELLMNENRSSPTPSMDSKTSNDNLSEETNPLKDCRKIALHREYDHSKLLVVNKQEMEQKEGELSFLRARTNELEIEVDKSNTARAAAEKVAIESQKESSQKDRDVMELMKSMGDVHKAAQCNIEEANKARQQAESKVSSNDQELSMSRSVNSKLTVEKNKLLESFTEMEEQTDKMSKENTNLRELLVTQSEEMESTAANLRVETEIRARAEIKEKEERNERISTSAQMVAMVREHAQSEACLKEQIAKSDATWEEKSKVLNDRIKVSEESLVGAKQQVLGLDSECSSLKDTLAKADNASEEENKKRITEIAVLRGEVNVMTEKIVLAVEEQIKAAEESELREEKSEKIVRKLKAERRVMHNTIQELRGNVRVFARVRPFLPNDGVPISTEPSIIIKNENGLQLCKENGEQLNFTFDRAFSPCVSQEHVFNEVSEFVQSALDGYNVCLFAYGQTGSGKTHTMQGSGVGAMRGIIARAMEQIGQTKASLETEGWNYDVKISFLEIYNETIRDLLRTTDSAHKKHEIKVLPNGKRFVSDLTVQSLNLDDANAIEDVMSLAAKHRSVASTSMNDVSSRSHSVFTLHLTAKHDIQKQSLKGTLNLVDLAGSERLKRSEASGDKAKETMAINKSLSSLTSVFVALGKKNSHIPFRNSKLTYLLQNCLSGDGKTLMVVNLSPMAKSANESLCSLRFAAQVNKCELGQAKRSVEDISSPNQPPGRNTAVPKVLFSGQIPNDSDHTTPKNSPSCSVVTDSSESLDEPKRLPRKPRSIIQRPKERGKYNVSSRLKK